jgi:hypothetical protein
MCAENTRGLIVRVNAMALLARHVDDRMADSGSVRPSSWIRRVAAPARSESAN